MRHARCARQSCTALKGASHAFRVVILSAVETWSYKFYYFFIITASIQLTDDAVLNRIKSYRQPIGTLTLTRDLISSKIYYPFGGISEVCDRIKMLEGGGSIEVYERDEQLPKLVGIKEPETEDSEN